MNLEGIALQLLTRELTAALSGGKIFKIFMPSRASLLLQVNQQNRTVNLLVDTAPGTAGSGLKPECAAVFVADGVRYTLSGHVTQQTMRAIVDSMSYA